MVDSSLEQSLVFSLLSARLGTAGRLVHLVVPAAQWPCPRAQPASRLLSGDTGVESPMPLVMPSEIASMGFLCCREWSWGVLAGDQGTPPLCADFAGKGAVLA